MRVCWDAEVSVRAPCGALSSQDSRFLPISRMIMGVPDAAGGASAAGGLARDGELHLQRVLQRDTGCVGEASVAVDWAEVLDVEHPLRLTAYKGLFRHDAAVADDLHPGADPLALCARDRRVEGDAAAGAEQTEGHALDVVRGQGADAVDRQRRIR